MLSATNPFSFLLFGASGHLAKLKLYPALYVLALKKRLPEHYSVVGFSRSEMDDKSFRALVEEAVRKELIEVNEEVLAQLLSHFFYHQGQYDEVKDFSALNKKLITLEKGWKDAVRVAYLSIPPGVFSDVLRNLCAGEVHDHKGKTQFRCIVEKPVGSDLKSAEEIYAQLTKCFAPEEVFLLDHYLGKEAVRNVFYLRYANPILERLAKNTLIHHVEITASEPKGLEGRAGYFEHSGTLRDMFQSHLLMIAALLTMRLEKEEDFRAVRLNALQQLYLPPHTSLNDIVLQGQYGKSSEAPAYTDEEGVEKDSRTNTYVALKLASRTSRWEGVPFFLQSGKRLEKKETRISVQFQEPRSVGKGSTPNRLDIILQGEAGMRIHMQTKLGGTEPEFRPLILEDPLVCVGDCLPEHGLLLLEAIRGKQQWFLSFEEVRTAWRLMDPVQAHLEKEDTPLHMYASGSKCPTEAEEWIGKDGIEWF